MTSATPKPRAGEHVEPWRVGHPRDSSGVRFIEEGGHATIGKIYDEVDAQRIVACVNACEGIPSDILEAQNPGGALHGMTKELQAERDLLRERERELVEALSILYDETADYIRTNHLGDVHHNRSMQLARTALAKGRLS